MLSTSGLHALNQRLAETRVQASVEISFINRGVGKARCRPAREPFPPPPRPRLRPSEAAPDYLPPQPWQLRLHDRRERSADADVCFWHIPLGLSTSETERNRSPRSMLSERQLSIVSVSKAVVPLTANSRRSTDSNHYPNRTFGKGAPLWSKLVQIIWYHYTPSRPGEGWPRKPVAST
jgi:hypothetical protein